MSSLALLTWILLGIAVQLTLWLGIGFLRHWREYQALRNGSSPQAGNAVRGKPVAEPAATSAWSGYRRFKVERKIIENEEGSICSFYLVPEDGRPLPTFKPGQFLTFRIDCPGPNGTNKQIVRCYSLSDAPNPGHYRISVKRVPPPTGRQLPPGLSSSYFHDQVTVGSVLQVRAPGGHFHIDHGDEPLVLIGGGIGITPMLSMLHWSLAEQPEREIWLFYGVRNGREAVLKEQLTALAATHPGFHLHFCYSQPLAEEMIGRDFQHRGRVDIELLRLKLPLKPYQYYICGPTPMMETLVHALKDWGVPDVRIHFEAFGPASIRRQPAISANLPAEADEAAITAACNIIVIFAKSGKQLTWQPGIGTLLEFAEANGITADSGCRTGSCGTCQTTIRSGEVAYRQSPDFDPEPGTCLLCVCAPKTSVTLEM